jgi:SAM-dependent methyltransferase
MDEAEYALMAENGDRHWWYHSTRTLLDELMAPYVAAGPANGSARVALDAGGGTGATGRWLTEHCTTVLADFDTFSLGFARDHAGYVPTRADLNHLPFADESFDIVLCVTALCHRMNPDPAAIVRDFARVTKPQGVICLMEPGGKRLWRSHDEVTQTARRFSVGEMRAMAESAGLDVLKSTGAYSFLLPPAAALTLARSSDQGNSDVGRNQSGLGGVLGALAAAERRLLRRVSLPVGLSAITIARKPG